MVKPSIILDCDPGHDDVVALVVAAEHCDLLGISTVAGNAALDRSTENAIAAAELLSIDVEVHRGAVRPLVRSARHATRVHGESGLVGTDLPPAMGTPSEVGAVEWILEESRRVDDLWIVATGPLTNVALALQSDPGLAARIGGVSIMGGGISFGNVTPAAEFNIWFDPHAAAVVFDSGVRLLMCGLDVTHQVLVDKGYCDRVRSLGSAVGPFLADVMWAYASAYRDSLSGEAACPLHDPCAVLALTHPDLFGFESLHVKVETRGILTEGMTVADRRRVRGADPANVDVSLEVDVVAVLDLIHDAISARC